MSEALQADVLAVGQIAAMPMILDVICRTTGMGFAVVARVTGERWLACAVRDNIAFGLKSGGELEVETTLCHEIASHHKPIIISHVAEDPMYGCHPTPAKYGFQSYIAVPIILPDGTFFGTLCALDPRPAQLNTPEIITTFNVFAELIAFHLNSLNKMQINENRLSDEREVSALREQFIAVLGHDLRNPLAAISSGVHLIGRTPINEKAQVLVGMINKSVARMAGLIDNILDFAHGRLGDGITLERETRYVLPILEQVLTELQVAHADRVLDVDFDVTLPINCDQRRVGQLFSNLLGNALTHGATGSPIRARASDRGGFLELSVSNAGEPISPLILESLFQPFKRGAGAQTQQGLGLGLYISSQIARAHGGEIAVISSIEQTQFTFRMPLV